MEFPEVLEIEVTEKHISDANLRTKIPRSVNCPISRCVKELYPDATGVSTGSGTTTIYYENRHAIYDISVAGSEFVWMYDQGEFVSPISLQLKKIVDYKRKNVN